MLPTQDIALIPMLALLPLLDSRGGGERGHAEAAPVGDGKSATMVADMTTWIGALSGWGVTLATFAAIAIVILGGTFLTRLVFDFASRARLREMQAVVTLLLVTGVAGLMSLVGLSPALGTFVAGVVLANSEIRHELEADIEPFKGLLLGLFFITVGAGIDFGTFMGAPFVVLGLLAGLMATKGAILYALAVLARVRGRDRILFTLSLAQTAEFGFVLFSVAVQDGVLDGDLAAILLLAIAVSMLLTPHLFIAYERLAARAPLGEAVPDDEIDEHAEEIVAGVGRFGQVVQRMLQGAGLRALILDRDIETIRLLRNFGIKTYMGDPNRPELLEAAGLRQAKVLVIALDDREAAVRPTRMAKAANPRIHIVARAYDRVHVYELYRAGPTTSCARCSTASPGPGATSSNGSAGRRARRMTRARRSVATTGTPCSSWQSSGGPACPWSGTREYAAKARELDKGLENALLTRFGEDSAAAAAAEGPLGPPPGGQVGDDIGLPPDAPAEADAGPPDRTRGIVR